MLKTIQKNVDPIYHSISHLYKIIIQAYKNHLVFTTSLNNYLLDIFGLINHLHISIINHKAVYKSMKKKYLDKNKDNKLYLTNF